MKRIFTLIIACILYATAFTQTPNVQWSRYIATKDFEMDGEAIYDAKRTADNGFIMVGYDTGLQYDRPRLWNKTAYGEGWIFKTNSQGDFVWRIRPGTYQVTGGYAQAYTAVELAGDGGFVVTGYGAAFTSPFDNGEAHVVRLSSDGTILWYKVFGGSGTDRAYSVKVTSDGGYIVAGNSSSADRDITTAHGGSDAWLVKLDADGNKQWSLTYGGTGNDTAYDVIQVPDGGYMIAGTSASADGDLTGNKGNSDGWVFKVDAAGALQWQKNLGGSAQDVLNNVVRNNDDTYTLSGYSYSDNGDVADNHGNADVWLLKTDNAGNVIWSRLYGGSNDDAMFDLCANAGGFLATGFTESNDGNVLSGNAGGANFWTIAFNQSGILRWERSNGIFKDEWAYTVMPTDNDSYVVTGIAEIFTPTSPDYGTDAMMTQLGKANTIKGTLFLDENSNGIKDAGEPYFSEGVVTAQKTGYSSSVIPYNGVFEISADTGTYITTVKVNHLYHTVTPASRQSVFTTYNNQDSFSFAVQPLPLKKDLVMHMIPGNIARPGFAASYQLIYENVGTMSIPAGTVKFVKDSRTSFVSAIPAPSNIVADTLFWNLTGLTPQSYGNISVNLTIAPPPTVNFGNILNFMAAIGPVENDETPGDDTAILRQLVSGSYDPNDKTEANGGVITPQQVNDGDYLNYLIRFQNTGTDTAFTIFIRDTLDTQLDWGTLQMVSASHPYVLTITDDNKLSWVFNNILLADSNINEPASHGYIAYRIRPRATVAVGDTIRNTAGIYFDFNPPVATNMAKTAIAIESTLPVNLASFKAALNGAIVNISWKTTAEYNSDYFEVQRSTNGADFITIGKVQVKNAATGASYAFNDETPATGYNYYRLKTVDLDRSSKLSSTAIVLVKGADIVSAVYPNPTDGEVTVDVRGNITGNVSVAVIDQAGRVVMAKAFGRPSASRMIEPLSLGRMPKGIYTLRVTVGETTTLHKLVVK